MPVAVSVYASVQKNGKNLSVSCVNESDELGMWT